MRRLPSRPWTISPWLSFKMAVVKCEGITLLFQEKSEIFLTGRERGKGEKEKEKEEKERERDEPLPPLSLHFFSTSSFEVRIMATRGQHVVKKQLQLS